MFRYLIFVFLATLINSTMEFEMTQQEMKAAKGKFCGSHLSDMLSMICDGVYNTKQKRGMLNRNDLSSHQEPSETRENLDSLEYPEEPFLGFPFTTKQRANSIIPNEFRKRSHGVASECCHKPCSLWEMSGYCGTQ